MLRRALLCFGLVGLMLCSTGAALAARPAASLLPGTTRGFLSVPNVEELCKHFDASLLGQLVNDPAMQPFVGDMKAQLAAARRLKFGLNWNDLEGIYGGEAALAAVQPNGEPLAHAAVLLVDVTGHVEQAQAAINKAVKNLTEQGATSRTAKVGEAAATVVVIPASEPGQAAKEITFLIHADRLLVCDHAGTASYVVTALAAEPKDSLAQLPAFREGCQQLATASQDPVHLTWFVDPFGYAEVARASTGGKKKRGTDYLKVLTKQGFRCVQGLAGNVSFSQGEHEILHRTFVYAPAVKRAAGDDSKDKYNLAARMLSFPNTKKLSPQDWVPSNVSTYSTFNIKTKEAFEYSKTLVDELAGSEVFEDVLESLEQDPNGPRINIRKELVAHLGDRASILTDFVSPIDTRSERMVVAVELTNPTDVAAAINKALKTDPHARRIEVAGHVIWEIVNEEDTTETALKIEGVGIGEEPAEEEEEGSLPNSAITVAHGQLLVGTHVDFVKELLTRPAENQRFETAPDRVQVDQALTALGANEDAARMFSRCDDEIRVTYEMIRQNKMPQSESLLGKLLNQIMAPEEKGATRSQKIDGTSLPDFEVIRKHFGVSGSYVRAHDDGWLMTGCLLKKK